jgi:hypothetical protein
MAGFELSKSFSAGDYTGRVTRVYLEATDDTGLTAAVAIGDCVNLTGESNSDGVKECDAVNSASQSTRVYGVVVGIAPDLANESFATAGAAADAARYAYVIDDPNAMFEVECDATLDAADVGLNAGIVGTAPTLTGSVYVSNMKIDSSTKATTQTLPFRIEQLLEGATSGTLGDRALVKLNATFNTDGVAGV